MNTNDLVYDIAKRAKELADTKMPVLRNIVESQMGSRTRGQLIEEALIEEFTEEYPIEITSL